MDHSIILHEYLDQGDITSANRLLGYHYQSKGIVIYGEQRGRTLGFPTVNIGITGEESLPAEGVYAVKVGVLGKTVLGMASIGRKETFGEGHALTLEVNLLDFSQMVYGEHVVIYWHQRLRAQVKYTGAEALIEQLKRDEINTRNYFKGI